MGNPLASKRISYHRRNELGFRCLLAVISRAYELPDHPEHQMILFVDNDKADQAKAVRQPLEKHGIQIQIEWLPPESPELNLQQDIWQHMRHRFTHSHCFEELSALLDTVAVFRQELEDNPRQALRLLGKWAKPISS